MNMNGNIEDKKLSNGSEDNKLNDMDLNESEKCRNMISYCSSPIGSNSQFLINQADNDLRSTSLSPLFQNIQNCNNWTQSHLSYNAPTHESNEPDIENIEYVAQTPIENSRLLHVLSDLVKTFIDTEHDIQKHLIDMGIESKTTNKEDLLQSFMSLNDDINDRLHETYELCEDGPESAHNSIPLYFTSHTSHTSQNNEVEEDVVLGASRRLRTAVDRILKLLSEIVSKQHEHDFNSLLKKNEELLTELNEECVRRNKLTAQLLQIEDRVKSLEIEKTTLTEKLIDYKEIKRQLEIMRIKVNDLESERDKWINDSKRLEQEKCSFAQGLPQLQQNIVTNNSTDISAQNTALFTNTELVNDNDSLNGDVLQLQQERIKLLQRIHALTLECEQLKSERDDIVDDKGKESEDFMAQIEANEKNILSYRKFIEEQTHEREMERDEYHKELSALTERLKEKEKSESKLKSRFEEMDTQISCLTEEKCYKDKQLDDIIARLKLANNDINDLNTTIKRLEKESEKSNQLERQLRSKIDGLNEALELQIKINEESQNDMFANNLLEQITSKTQMLQNTLRSIDGDSESEPSSMECSFSDIRLLSEKLNSLNICIDQLLTQNNTLKRDLERSKCDNNKEFQELFKEKQSLERNLTEICRSNDLLKEELNVKHKQLSSLKSKLESAIDSSDMRRMFEEIQNKLISEEQKTKALDFEVISLRQQMDEKNNKVVQLMDELNNIKQMSKTLENEKFQLIRETNELRYKLKSKESLENNLTEIFRSNELLKEELNSKHKQLTSLKSKLESTANSSDLKYMFDELKHKLISEEQKTKRLDNELVLLKQQIDQKSKKILQLIDELNDLKEQLKRIELEKSQLIHENNELKLKLSNKESLERNLTEMCRSNEILKEKLIDKQQKLKILKSKLEVNAETSNMKHMFDELKTKLLNEEQKNKDFDFELISLKQQMDCKQIKNIHLTDELNNINQKLRALEVDKSQLMRENDELRLKTITTSSKDSPNGISSQLLWKLKRVISQKNALIHQKKYLLHVLGGFQLTERATLALLANMNVTVDDELPPFQSSKNKFRSVVYCVIAISRMKLLVKKWNSRTHLKSKSKTNISKTVSTHSLGATNERQTDSTLQEFVNRLQRLHDTLGLRTGQI